MIRWQYLSTRLLVLAAVLLLGYWTAAPVTQFVAVRVLSKTTGAKVEIASTDVGLFPPRIHFRGIAIADPRKEMRNGFEADEIHLVIDGGALVRRRFEIASGRISGVRVGGARTHSGWLEVVPEDPAAPEGPGKLQQWCAALAGDTKSKVEGFGEGLATVIESKRIRQQWELEYDQLRAEVEQIEDQVRTLKSTARSIDNPLRDLPALRDSLVRADEIRQRLKTLTERLDQLPSRFQSDMAAIDQARRTDQQRVAAYFPEGLRGSPTELGPELLGELVKRQLEQVRGYLESGRAIANATISSPQPERARGETIALDRRVHPAWLIRQCSIDGFLSVDSDQYTMQGVVENITTQPRRIDEPWRARLRLDGPRVVRIDYKRHFDSPVPRDHLRIHWPNVDLPATRIGQTTGDPTETAIVLDGGRLELWIDIETSGDEIRGQLVSQQKGTRIDLRTSPKLEQAVVVQSLKASLKEIDHVDVEATFAGNWRRLDLDIRTNLTACVADSLQDAIAAQVADTRQRLAGQVERTFQEHTRELKEWVTEQQSGARELLAQSDVAVDSMSKKVAAELGSADAYLGKVRSRLQRSFK